MADININITRQHGMTLAEARQAAFKWFFYSLPSKTKLKVKSVKIWMR